MNAVYGVMLPQPRLRFLLADEPGTGKTIMAGLYLQASSLGLYGCLARRERRAGGGSGRTR
jgi:hypothetical protein